MLFLQNLPFTFGDDINNVHFVKTISWTPILRGVLNPFTPAWYVHGMDSLLTTRPFLTFLLKSLYELFGYNPNAFWCLKAASYAGVSALICLFLILFTQQKWLGILGSVFFCLLPPVYRSISWISDSEIIAEFFLVISFFVFLRLYTAEGRQKLSHSLLPVLVLIASAWLGMRLRETARMIPFVLTGFLLLHQNISLPQWLGQGSKNKLLFAVSLLLFFLVIPWDPAAGAQFDARSHLAIFNLRFDHLPQTLWPLFQTIGALLLLPIAMIIFILWRSGAKGDKTFWRKSSVPLFFFTIWSLFPLASFLLNFKVADNNRYLTTPLIPLILLTFTFFGNLSLEFNEKLRKYLRVGFLVVVLVSSQRNLDEIVFIRHFYGGIDIADYLLTKKAYEDRFNDPDASWEELDDFYAGRGLASKPEFQVAKIKEWDPNMREEVKPENLAKLASKHGVVYVLSLTDGLFQNEPRVKQLWKTTTANGSFYSWIMPKIKKKTNRACYLYKYQ